MKKLILNSLILTLAVLTACGKAPENKATAQITYFCAVKQIDKGANRTKVIELDRCQKVFERFTGRWADNEAFKRTVRGSLDMENLTKIEFTTVCSGREERLRITFKNSSLLPISTLMTRPQSSDRDSCDNNQPPIYGSAWTFKEVHKSKNVKYSSSEDKNITISGDLVVRLSDFKLNIFIQD